MNQIEFILRLSENAQDKGNDIANRHNAERAQHINELQELWRINQLAGQNILAELKRFGVSLKQPEAEQKQLPKNEERMPRVVQKGPATEPPPDRWLEQEMTRRLKAE